MLEVTYYYVERFVDPAQGWKRVRPQLALRDRAQAEQLLQEEKALWDQYLASSIGQAMLSADLRAGDEVLHAHIKRLQALGDWRIVEETETFTHASLYMYSDVKAYEIVKVISEQTLEVRPMKTTHSAAGLKFTPGS